MLLSRISRKQLDSQIVPIFTNFYYILLVADREHETLVSGFLEVPWFKGKLNKANLLIFYDFSKWSVPESIRNFARSWNLAKKMKKSLAQLALNSFFGWFRVPGLSLIPKSVFIFFFKSDITNECRVLSKKYYFFLLKH